MRILEITNLKSLEVGDWFLFLKSSTEYRIMRKTDTEVTYQGIITDDLVSVGCSAHDANEVVLITHYGI